MPLPLHHPQVLHGPCHPNTLSSAGAGLSVTKGLPICCSSHLPLLSQLMWPLASGPAVPGGEHGQEAPYGEGRT